MSLRETMGAAGVYRRVQERGGLHGRPPNPLTDHDTTDLI